MTIQNLEALFVHTLKDIHYAENKIAKALPKMIKAAQDDELKTALSDHLEETRGQIERLQQVFEALGKKPASVKCEAIEGILKEGDSIVLETKGAPIVDNAIAAAGQAVEHYEMMRYKSLLMWCEQLGLDGEVGQLLQQNLDEEVEADEKLGEIGSRLETGEDDDDEEDATSAGSRRSYPASRRTA